MSAEEFAAGLDYARRQDHADGLRQWREEFNFPDARGGYPSVYLCGNSLGLQPKLAVRYVREELEDWGRLGVEGHFGSRRPWLPYHRLAVPGLAELAGALESEVVAMNTLTVNLHLLMTSFYRPGGERRKIVVESTVFPSDRYAVVSQLRLHGLDPDEALLEWTARDDGELRLEDLERLLAEASNEVALLLLPGVQYYNGQLLDMEALCRLGRQHGAAVGLDLAHAIGNVPLSLHDWGADFAAWCSYKYLNAGPGAVGGAFVHERHHGADLPRLHGWWGHVEDSRFRMAPEFRPAGGADAWQLSNPPILSLAPVIASLELFRRAGMKALRRKSLRLTGYLDFLLREQVGGRVRSVTPAAARGCQLSLVVQESSVDARALFRRLEEQNVAADWREPNVIRVAPAPLYNSFGDVFEFVQRLLVALGENREGA